MRPPAALLWVSLATNAVLVALMVTSRPSALEKTAVGMSIASSEKSATGSPSAESGDLSHLEKTWGRLLAGDLRTLATRLRDAGFPPSAVRALVSERVEAEFSERRKALLAQRDVFQFWKNSRTWVDLKNMLALSDLAGEQARLLRECLGSNWVSDRDDLPLLWPHLDYLSAEKAGLLRAVLVDYGTLRLKMMAEANGRAPDPQKIDLLETEQRADVARVLTPQELEEYDLRESKTASTLRTELDTFNATEAEFRALFRIIRTAEEQYGPFSKVGPNRQIHGVILEKAQGVLGPERYAELKRNTYFND